MTTRRRELKLCFACSRFPGSCIGTGEERILSTLIRLGSVSTAIGLGKEAVRPACQTL